MGSVIRATPHALKHKLCATRAARNNPFYYVTGVGALREPSSTKGHAALQRMWIMFVQAYSDYGINLEGVS
jgi:hypothetical protein